MDAPAQCAGAAAPATPPSPRSPTPWRPCWTRPDAARRSPGRRSAGRYDEARTNYHSELVVVATSTVREVARQGRLLTMLNRREISARRGLTVSGLQTTGKSTALKQ